MSKGKKANSVCLHCEKPFWRKPSDIRRRGAKYCSQECYRAAKPKLELNCVCQVCRKRFHRRPSAIARSGGKYCSNICRRKPRQAMFCEMCGDVFFALPSQVKQRGYGRFCSQSCRSRYTVREQFWKKPTTIERALMEALDTVGLRYEAQYSIAPWLVDLAIPEARLAVEADGVYWHGLEAAKARDRRKDEGLQSLGWTVLRFSGDEIRASAIECAATIARHAQVEVQHG